MMEVMVFIEGGVLQGAIANSPGLLLTIVDYDNEDEGDKDRTPRPVHCDPARVALVHEYKEEDAT